MITIHRGSHQIGGCVTEISTKNARVFIDLGADLIKDKKESISKIDIDGLTIGNAENNVLLITHYHGDHIGRLIQALPGLRIYMGKTAKNIYMAISKRLEKAERFAKVELIDKKEIEILEKTNTFEPGEKLEFGDIKVTSYMIDHSAFDAYSFLIEANGERIFYTGDFRLHGPRGKLKLYKTIKNIDYLICEGTNISKMQKAQTEFELKAEAKKLFENPKHKNIFILCSSTNIDRIFEFYHAYKETFSKKRPFICDMYQKEILEIVKKEHSKKARFYDFDKIYDYRDNNNKLKNWMDNTGFCFLIRQNSRLGVEVLNKYFTEKPDECLLIYSMWSGYIKENNKAKNDELIEFLKPYKSSFMELHTSGHADLEGLKKIEEIIKPKHIIPIHTQEPEEFVKFFKNTILLEDGVPYKAAL
jgi:ribonuclease J